MTRPRRVLLPRRPLVALVIALGLGAACGKPAPLGTKIPIATSAQLCQQPKMGKEAFCMPSHRLERMLRDSPIVVRQAYRTESGTSGAYKMFVELPDEHLVIKAKWKEAGDHGTALNNEPRKEIAAYRLQRLFLTEDEYVVPPTATRCFPIEFYRIQVREGGKPAFEGTECVFGALSYWVEHIEELKGEGKDRFDRERFDRDPAYRDTVANLNILTFLIDHRDTRRGNFVLSKDQSPPRALAIDNGLAFSGLQNPRTIVLKEWQEIIVPALPRSKIDKLRTITRAELDGLLLVVAQFKLNGKQLEAGEPTASLPNVDDPVRDKDGMFQLGLKRSEIDGVEARLKELVRLADEGKVKLY
jgi:hypothetical protein